MQSCFIANFHNYPQSKFESHFGAKRQAVENMNEINVNRKWSETKLICLSEPLPSLSYCTFLTAAINAIQRVA